jgi:hypothetical protein
MPGFDGTGPQGKGPMTGRAQGYCALRHARGESVRVQGFAGAQGTPVEVELPQGKEMMDMPFGAGMGPAGAGRESDRTTGFFAGYPAPGYGHPVRAGAVPPVGVYGTAPYGCRPPWWLGRFWRPRFAGAFGRGRVAEGDADVLAGGKNRRRNGLFGSCVMPRGDGTGPAGQGPGTGRGLGRGRGRGRMGGPFAAGPGGECVCPRCGYRAPHVAGQPCNQRSCPTCGRLLTRG